MNDEKFEEMARDFEALYKIDEVFDMNKSRIQLRLRTHEFICRKRTQFALERIAKALEEGKK